MNIRFVFVIVGSLLIVLAAVMLLPLGIAVVGRESTCAGWLAAIAITLIAGFLMRRFHRNEESELTHRDAFLVVTLTWVLLSVFGGLPFLITGVLDNPVDALFEAMSGFTTTGATMMSGLDTMAPSVLFWRAFTQWIGGMGIIVLSIAILPWLGIGGVQLYKAEVAGLSKDRLTPRVAETAKLLWGVYLILTLAETFALRFAGMNFFDALCHSFTTMASGGFSTHDASIAFYQNPAIEWILIVFMFLAGVNFSLHYQALRGDFSGYRKDVELKFYMVMIGSAVIVVVANIWLVMQAPFMERLRTALFSVLTVVTTTGFTTTDFDRWPDLSRFILLTLMFLGGCAGSTAGGLKNNRVFLLIKQALREIKKFIFPKAVIPVKIGTAVVPDEVMQNVQGFFLLFMAWFFLASAVLAIAGIDIITACSAVVTCMSNIGPGLGGVGPSHTFAHLPDLAKITLTASMLVGRLELFTVFVLFFPATWKR